MMRSPSASLSRRNFLQLGIGAAGAELCRSVLPGFGELHADMQRKTRGVIIVLLAGGMSQMDSFDYKPNALKEHRGPFKGISTKSGAVYSELFPKLAAMDDKYALVRSVKSPIGMHTDAYERWLAPSRDQHLIDLTMKRGASIPYVNILTPGVSPLFQPEREKLRLEHALKMEWDPKDSEFLAAVRFDKPEGHETRTVLRDRLQKGQPANDATERFAELQRKANAIVMSSHRTAFAEDPSALRAARTRYGEHAYGDSFRMAGIMADKAETGVVVVETGHWDHHRDLKTKMSEMAPKLDQALAALIEEYGDRLTICVRGEFGRSPTISKIAFATEEGRDHWPVHSAILAGPNVQPGIHGSTNAKSGDIANDPVDNEQFNHTLLEAAGALPATIRSRALETLLKGRG